MRPIERVLELLPDARRTGNGWMARCPAHDDHNPSLSIAEGDELVLLHCHAGCALDAILAKLQLTSRDLRSVLEPRPGVRSPRSRWSPSFATLEIAITNVTDSVRRLKASQYELAHDYRYLSVDGSELHMLRFEAPGKDKVIRPVSSSGGRWHAKRGPAKTLPYRIDELEGQQFVLVPEGEKCADALRELGFTATTSAGGASAAHRTDWTRLRDRVVVAFPDNDAHGAKYVSDVAIGLGRSSLPTVELPVQEGEDVADYIANRRRAGDSVESIREILNGLIQEQLETLTQLTESSVPARVDFPMLALPVVVREFSRKIAGILSADPAVLVLGALVAMSSAIGRSVMLRVTEEWFQNCALWVAVVAPSGRGKTPAINAALRHINKLDSEARRKYEASCKLYATELERHQLLSKQERMSSPPPVRPTCQQLIVTDLTIEALITMLEENPRGLLYAPDELDSFFASLDRYRTGSGSDRPQWLSLYSGGPIRYERKTSGSTRVDHSFVSMIGGIQPPVLARNFQGEGASSGLAARFILYQPLPVPRVLRRKSDTSSARAAFDTLLDRLYSIALKTDRGDQASILELSEEAGDLLEWFVQRWDQRYSTEPDDDLRSASAKMESHVLRIALILHVADHACAQLDDAAPLRAVDIPPLSRDAMRGAIEIVRWAMGSARRTYAELRQDLNLSKLEARAEALRARHGGNATHREWQRARFRLTTDQARRELDELVQVGLAEWITQPSEGRPGPRPAVCRLLPQVPEGRGVFQSRASEAGDGLDDLGPLGNSE